MKNTTGRRRLLPHEEVRVLGGRRILKRPDEVELAVDPKWMLVEVTGWSANGWRSLKLLRAGKTPKSVWYLGIKDGKLAKSKELFKLQIYHPEMVDWIIAKVDEYENKCISKTEIDNPIKGEN